MAVPRRVRMSLVALGYGCAALAAEPATLTFHSPAARSVCVAGSFAPGWQECRPMTRDHRGQWSAVLELAPGRYELLFLVDGEWRASPELPLVKDGFGGVNNILVVPSAE